MNKKAQGTIEYLVIIAIVVVIALVVVGLLLQILGNFGGANETSLKTTWKTATPFAIIDWTKTESELQLVLKNNTADTLYLNDVNINGATNGSNLDKNAVSMGSTIIVKVPGLSDACPGNYVYSKGTIDINYNTSILNNVIQRATADIAGSC